MLSLLITSSAAKPPVKVGDPLAFYTVAATIIPVLFLALIYEAKVLDLLGRFTRLYVAEGVGVVAVTAEAWALDILASQQPSAHAARSIAAVMLIMGIAVVVQPMLGALDTDLAARKRELAALGLALENTRSRVYDRKERLRVLRAEFHDRRLAFDSGSIDAAAITETLAKSEDAASRVEAEQRDEAPKVAELEAVYADLQQRTERAGAPLPAWVVISGAAISAVLGILSIYGAL